MLKTFGIVSGQGYILGGVNAAQAAGGGQVAEEAAAEPEAAPADGEPEVEMSPADAAAAALFENFPIDDSELEGA
ncbi:MAG TPA: hypothetical protein DIT93_07180, partial [Pelagibacterium sp.]|nr:hypothetical protein [Pelagibacterium sp.]